MFSVDTSKASGTESDEAGTRRDSWNQILQDPKVPFCFINGFEYIWKAIKILTDAVFSKLFLKQKTKINKHQWIRLFVVINISRSVGLICRQSNLSAPQWTVHVHTNNCFEIRFRQSPVTSTIQIKQRSETTAPSAYTSKMSPRLENWITHQFVGFFITNLIKIMGNWIVQVAISATPATHHHSQQKRNL